MFDNHEDTIVTIHIPATITLQVAVSAEAETITIIQSTVTPDAGYAGYFGPMGTVDDVEGHGDHDLARDEAMRYVSDHEWPTPVLEG